MVKSYTPDVGVDPFDVGAYILPLRKKKLNKKKLRITSQKNDDEIMSNDSGEASRSSLYDS